MNSTPVIAKSDIVRVRLQTEQERLLIQGSQISVDHRLVCRHYCSLDFDFKKKQVLLRAKGLRQSWSIAPSTHVAGEGLRLGAKRISDEIIISPKAKGFEVIGHEVLSNYILGVLSSEMPIRWPEETLKAQAVAIRSYTLATKIERKDKQYDVESSVLDQVFSIKPLKNKDRHRLLRLIEETKDKRLVNARGKTLKAFYHADCGGQTVPAKDVWGGSEGAGIAKDPVCATRQLNRWSWTVEKSDFLRTLQGNLKRRFQYFPDFDWSQRQVLPHKEFVVNYQGEKLLVAGNELRSWLGFSNLKSTRFKAIEKGDRIEFQGQGFGHGVGLCQWGSRELGIAGKSYQDILKHYYPLARIASKEPQSDEIN